MQLTDNFSLEEMTASEYAERKGMDNTPPDAALRALHVTAQGMESVRAILAAPVHVNSGYRSPALNKAIGGAANSAHVLGYACDFICPGFGPPLAIAKKLIEAKASFLGLNSQPFAFDQIIMEGTWVHISFDPRRRGQTLTAHFKQGTTTYTDGI
jgi:hypothetical protein